MKLLLDENLPHAVRKELPGHDVFTTAFMGWAGLRNGDLLVAAASAGFDAIITTDRGLEYQQHAQSLPLSVVILVTNSNTIDAVRKLYPSLLTALLTIAPRSLCKVKLD